MSNPKPVEAFGTYLARRQTELESELGHKLTQAAFAELIKTRADNPLLKCTLQQVNHWLSNRRPPSPEVEAVVRAALG